MAARKGKKARTKFVPFAEVGSVDDIVSAASMRRHVLVLLDTVDETYVYSTPSVTQSDYEPVFGAGAPSSLAEAAVCDAIRSITYDCDVLAEMTAAAHERLSAMHAAARDALERVCDREADRDDAIRDLSLRTAEVSANIDALKARKFAAFEAELVAFDAVLEHVQRECGSVRSSLSALPDADLPTHYATLVSRVEGIVPTLRSVLPRVPKESPALTVAASPWLGRPLPKPLPAGFFITSERLARVVVPRQRPGRCRLQSGAAAGDDADAAAKDDRDAILAAAADGALGRFESGRAGYDQRVKARVSDITASVLRA
jgi:hypothetical protein